MSRRESKGRKADMWQCNEATCEQNGVFRYTWPGRDEAAACLEHARQLEGIALAMGLHMQMILLSVEEQCAHEDSVDVSETE